MLTTRSLLVSAGMGAVGAVVLLSANNHSLAATLLNPTSRDVQLAAQPFGFSFGKDYPWTVAPAPSASSSGVAGIRALYDGTSAAAAATLKTVNQLGPITFDLNSLRALSANSAPPGSHAGTANYTEMDQWASGVAGLASSAGALGFAENATSYDPFVGTHTGVLQTNNQLGPAFFDLNVLKAIGFTQAPTGAVLSSGQPDNFSAVDIGRWSAGIPGVITNTGTTGFVTYQDFGNGPIHDYRVAGLHTTTQIGGQTFDFNVLPFISTGIIPPSLAFGLAPDMTAANTPFAPNTPPTPGTIQPMGGLPTPPIVNAPTTLVAPAAPTATTVTASKVAAPSDDAPDVTTVQADDTTSSDAKPIAAAKPAAVTKPTITIPGVNGAPLSKTPKTGTTGSGGSNPLKPITDMISKGLGAITGVKPSAGGTAAGSGSDAGGSSSGGSAGGGAGDGGGDK
jgi:hypothetical protein